MIKLNDYWLQFLLWIKNTHWFSAAHRGPSHASTPSWCQHGRVSLLSLSPVSTILLPYTSRLYLDGYIWAVWTTFWKVFNHLTLPTVLVVKIVSGLNCQLLFQAADKPGQKPNTFPDGVWGTSCPHLPLPRMTERSTMPDVFWPIWKRVCWFALYNYVWLVVCVWK